MVNFTTEFSKYPLLVKFTIFLVNKKDMQGKFAKLTALFQDRLRPFCQSDFPLGEAQNFESLTVERDGLVTFALLKGVAFELSDSFWRGGKGHHGGSESEGASLWASMGRSYGRKTGFANSSYPARFESNFLL